MFEVFIFVTAKILTVLCYPESSRDKTRTEEHLLIESKQSIFFPLFGWVLLFIVN